MKDLTLCIGVWSAILELKIRQSCNGPAPMTTLFSRTISDFRRFWPRAAQDSPSVIQVRSQDVMPEAIGASVVSVLRQHADQLHTGAIITIDEMTSRLRILPIQRKSSPSH
jgi:hypothetical protein